MVGGAVLLGRRKNKQNGERTIGCPPWTSQVGGVRGGAASAPQRVAAARPSQRQHQATQPRPRRVMNKIV